MSYKEMMQFQYNVLDQIDFKPFINKHKGEKFDNLISDVMKTYNNTELSNVPPLNGDIFNCISDDELLDYLSTGYPEFDYTKITQTFIV